MKKTSILWPLLAIISLAGCSNGEANPSVSSSESPQTESIDPTCSLSMLSDSYLADLQVKSYSDGSLIGFNGIRTAYVNTDKDKYFSSRQIGLNQEMNLIYAPSAETYHADIEGEDAGYVYSEHLNVNNDIEKHYIYEPGSDNRLEFDTAFDSAFALFKDRDFEYDGDGSFIVDEAKAKRFVSQFIGGDLSEDYECLAKAEDGVLSHFEYSTGSFSFVADIIAYGTDVEIERVSPFRLDEGDNSELIDAIEALGSNYTATHYRTGEKSIVYYDGSSIVVDHGADGLGSQDEYYHPGEEGLMLRTVFGSDDGSHYGWNKDNYTQMLYDDDKTYADLSLRLSSINPGFFHKESEGKYVSIEGSAALLFPYAQPAMNSRALINDGAISVSIELENGSISRIKLKYNYDQYGGGGVSKSDTIIFGEVGSTSIPREYATSLR